MEPLATCEKGCNPILLACNKVCRALTRTCLGPTSYVACLETGNGTAPGDCQQGTVCNDVLDACTACAVSADCQTAAALKARGLELACVAKPPVCLPDGTCSNPSSSDFVPAGTDVTPPGDCHKRTCDGAGNGALLVDDTDLPALDECAPLARCSQGTPVEAPRFRGAVCNGGNGRCDGISACKGVKSCAAMPAGPTARGAEMCAIARVTGGAFLLNKAQTEDPIALVTPHVVSSFWVDRYEVTVGRFRRFVQAYEGWRDAGHPAAMEGFDSKLRAYAGGDPCVGWDQHDYLPGCKASLDDRLASQSYTWTAAEILSPNGYPLDERPLVGGIPWSLAEAFCLWDGGRLPTYVERYHLAARGDEYRDAPWLAAPAKMANATETDASWGGAHGTDPVPNGSGGTTYLRPCLVGGLCASGGSEDIADRKNLGDASRYRDIASGISSAPVFDLAGSATEWVLDARTATPVTDVPCVDCVRSVSWKVTNGKSTVGYSWLDTPSPSIAAVWKRQGDGLCAEGTITMGFRCVYTDRGDERPLAPPLCLDQHTAAAPGIDCDGPRTPALCP